MKSIYWTEMDSPIGTLQLGAGPEGLVKILFPREKAQAAETQATAQTTAKAKAKAKAVTRETVRQLNAYFAGNRKKFDLPLAPHGTPFQQRVWQALRRIPYGKTLSYGELASRRIGKPKAVRAVGAANGRNPLPIVIPCHRVIGSDGSLTGYGGGLHLKKKLLELEKADR